MRFIFIDEAGTAENEPATIVVGLVVDADAQLLRAQAAVNEVLGAVPQKFREGFVFHAAAIWGSPKYREGWGMTDRLALLKAMMRLPRRLGLTISYALVRRSLCPTPESKKITKAQFHHFMAFAFCLARADKYIREHGRLEEVGTIVAEDVPEMRKFLRIAPTVFREHPLIMSPDGIWPTEAEKRQGHITQESEFRVSRIRPNIHFVEKGDDPILQVADACAFGFRRYFSEQRFGKDFIVAILGREENLADYAGPSSSGAFYPKQ